MNKILAGDFIELSDQTALALGHSNFFQGGSVTHVQAAEFGGVSYAVGLVDVANYAESAKFSHTYGRLNRFEGGHLTTREGVYKGNSYTWGESKNENGKLLEFTVHFDNDDNSYIFRSLDITQEQWSLASGESYYLGDRKNGSTANEVSIKFWEDYKL